MFHRRRVSTQGYRTTSTGSHVRCCSVLQCSLSSLQNLLLLSLLLRRGLLLSSESFAQRTQQSLKHVAALVSRRRRCCLLWTGGTSLLLTLNRLRHDDFVSRFTIHLVQHECDLAFSALYLAAHLCTQPEQQQRQ